jgi:hypothetical protein
MHQFHKFAMKLYMFRTVRLSIRSLFTVPSAMVYVTQVCKQVSSRTRMVTVFLRNVITERHSLEDNNLCVYNLAKVDRLITKRPSTGGLIIIFKLEFL